MPTHSAASHLHTVVPPAHAYCPFCVHIFCATCVEVYRLCQVMENLKSAKRFIVRVHDLHDVLLPQAPQQHRIVFLPFFSFSLCAVRHPHFTCKGKNAQQSRPSWCLCCSFFSVPVSFPLSLWPPFPFRSKVFNIFFSSRSMFFWWVFLRRLNNTVECKERNYVFVSHYCTSAQVCARVLRYAWLPPVISEMITHKKGYLSLERNSRYYYSFVFLIIFGLRRLPIQNVIIYIVVLLLWLIPSQCNWHWWQVAESFSLVCSHQIIVFERFK